MKTTVAVLFTTMLFRKGHRIRLEVSSSNFPQPEYRQTDRHGAETITAHQTIHHNSSTPSRLILPVTPRREPA